MDPPKIPSVVPLESLAKIAAVDRVEAGRPGKIEAAKSRDQRRVGVVVGHVQVIGAIDQVLQRLLAGRRCLGQLSAPVAAQVPVSAADAGDVAAKDDANV